MVCWLNVSDTHTYRCDIIIQYMEIYDLYLFPTNTVTRKKVSTRIKFQHCSNHRNDHDSECQVVSAVRYSNI